MRLTMKNMLHVLLCLTLFCQLTASAATLQVEKFSMPIKILNKVSQPISLNFGTSGEWKILVEPLDGQIRNLDYPNYTLPISRLEISDISGTPISHFEMGRSYEVKTGVTPGINTLSLALNMTLYDCDYPGNYVTDLKFTLIDKNAIVAQDVYSLRIMQDEISSIKFSKNLVNLSIDKDKVLAKNSSQSLPTPLGLYVSCNKNWKLYVRKVNNSNDQTFRYFVKVLPSGDSSITCNSTNEYIAMQETPLLLATGKSTINEIMNVLEQKLINVDYMIKGPEDKFIPAGSKSEEFEYRLETEN